MIFEKAEIELLKMVAACRILPAAAAERVFENENISSLTSLKMISRGKRGNCPDALWLLSKGASLLESVNFPQRQITGGKQATNLRNIQGAQILLTFYSAGIDTCTEAHTELENTPVYLSSAAARSRLEKQQQNIYGSTKIYGIAGMAETAYAAYYAESDELLHYDNEMKVFCNITAPCGFKQRALIFAGKSYAGIYRALTKNNEQKKQNRQSYGEIFKNTEYPVHLMSCDECGAQQLYTMSKPDYRAEYVKYDEKGIYEQPNDSLPDADYLRNGIPHIFGIDMDIKRVLRLDRQAKEAGYPNIVIAALYNQNVFYRSLLPDAELLTLTIPNSVLNKPERKPFKANGRYIYVSEIKSLNSKKAKKT